MQFLSGARKISMPLLLMIDAANLKLLFDHLSPSFENVRVTILIWIAAICNDKVFRRFCFSIPCSDGVFSKTDEERAKAAFSLVGQLAWFKNLLDDPNPLIAYHSSRFLSEYLQGQDPVQYSLALKKLIAIIPEDKVFLLFLHLFFVVNREFRSQLTFFTCLRCWEIRRISQLEGEKEATNESVCKKKYLVML
jgi:hypothetical protein